VNGFCGVRFPATLYPLLWGLVYIMFTLDSVTLGGELRQEIENRLTVKDLEGALRAVDAEGKENEPLGDFAPRFLKLLPESVAGNLFVFTSTWRYSLETVVNEHAVVHLGDMAPATWQSADFWEFPLSGLGDYAGDYVNEGNRRFMIEHYAKEGATFELLGGFGYSAFAVYLPCVTARMIMEACRLANYPSLSDEGATDVQNEFEEAALKDEFGLLGDFKRAIVSQFPEIEEALDAAELDNVRTVFYALMEATNTNFVHETGGSVYVDVERLVQGATQEHLHTILTGETTE
jgi:hypothetical protein